jgi:hypothetical protein
MSLVSPMDMTMAFGSGLAVSCEMEIPALRDDKSSKVEFKRKAKWEPNQYFIRPV